MRLLVVSKHFWPVSGEDELLVGALARQFSKLGHQVTVLTWRMVRQWPPQFRMDGCDIVRVPGDQRASWSPSALGYYSRNRWHRHMLRWINTNAENFDGAVVFESDGDDLLATVTVGRTNLRTVSRVRSEHLYPMTRQISRELSAAAQKPILFVTPDSRLGQQAELAEAYQNGTLLHQADGWPTLAKDPSVYEQKTQRNILGRVHPILKVDRHALLAVCGAEITFDSGVFSLVRAWRRVLAAHPDSRLWLLGSGANTNELFQRICDLDMQHSVLLPGSFDEIRDVLAAADAYIMPGAQDRLSWYSAVALQLGLTVVHHQDAPVTEDFRATHRSLPFDDDSRTIDLVLSRWAAATRSRSETSEVSDSSGERMLGARASDVPNMRSMAERYIELLESMPSATPTLN